MTFASRYLRQILLPEIGEAGQHLLGAAAAPVGGTGLSHEVATRYALAAGFSEVTEGPADVAALAPRGVVANRAAAEVLAGSRATLRAIRNVVLLERAEPAELGPGNASPAAAGSQGSNATANAAPRSSSNP